MFNSTTLEVGIGMALVYLLLSLFCTAINEAIAATLGSRAKNLERGIKSLFTEGLQAEQVTDGNVVTKKAVTLAEAIYNHGLIRSLYQCGPGDPPDTHAKKLPSYIPSRAFASALLAIVFPDDKANPRGLPTDLPSMLAKLNALPEGKGKEAIVTLVTQANGDIDKTREAFEKWYNDGMDRAAGWYKRKTQLVLFVIGLIVAIGLNVDSITIGRALWTSPALRSYAMTTAEQYAREKSKTSPSPDAPKDLSILQSLALPIGWDKSRLPWMEEHGTGLTYVQSFSKLSLIFVLCGWFLTAIAMTLGAPFWFDTLNKFMVVRSTIKPKENS
jgi:hypothetical protein